ncbi:hypothetical protein HDU97_004762 [Phlyctochytrium planicorne]|nr:hypothetical protein HDU97_004762 [Phlyctochytrium planicorne]
MSSTFDEYISHDDYDPANDHLYFGDGDEEEEEEDDSDFDLSQVAGTWTAQPVAGRRIAKPSRKGPTNDDDHFQVSVSSGPSPTAPLDSSTLLPLEEASVTNQIPKKSRAQKTLENCIAALNRGEPIEQFLDPPPARKRKPSRSDGTRSKKPKIVVSAKVHDDIVRDDNSPKQTRKKKDTKSKKIKEPLPDDHSENIQIVVPQQEPTLSIARNNYMAGKSMVRLAFSPQAESQIPRASKTSGKGKESLYRSLPAPNALESSNILGRTKVTATTAELQFSTKPQHHEGLEASQAMVEEAYCLATKVAAHPAATYCSSVSPSINMRGQRGPTISSSVRYSPYTGRPLIQKDPQQELNDPDHKIMAQQAQLQVELEPSYYVHSPGTSRGIPGRGNLISKSGRMNPYSGKPPLAQETPRSFSAEIGKQTSSSSFEFPEQNQDNYTSL